MKRKGKGKNGEHPLKGRKRSKAALRKFKATMARNRAEREAAKAAARSASPAAAVSTSPAELKGPAGVAARASAHRRAVFLTLLANLPDEFSRSDITGQPGAKKLSPFVMNRALVDAVDDGTVRRLSKGRYRKGAQSTEPGETINGHADAGVEVRAKLALKCLRDARSNVKTRLNSGRLSDEDRAHHFSALAMFELQTNGAAAAPDAIRYLGLARRAIADDMQAGRLKDEDAAHTLGKVALMQLQGEI